MTDRTLILYMTCLLYFQCWICFIEETELLLLDSTFLGKESKYQFTLQSLALDLDRPKKTLSSELSRNRVIKTGDKHLIYKHVYTNLLLAERLLFRPQLDILFFQQILRWHYSIEYSYIIAYDISVWSALSGIRKRWSNLVAISPDMICIMS